jgi:hypothetical protein
MASAYTPGLKRAISCNVKKTRKLPIHGRVLVGFGEAVSPDTVVAEATVQGDVQIVRVSSILGIDPDQLQQCMLKREGEEIKKGESIASYMALFGLINRVCKSPVDGTIELVSNVTGQVVVRETSSSITLKAFIPGLVSEILPEQGAVIECQAAYLQGIFGIGGETHGELRIVSRSLENILDKKNIGPEFEGKILVADGMVTSEALKQAIKVGAKGVVMGGIEDKDLTDFLGYEIGVAITGSENIGLTLVVLEGFSSMPPSKKAFEILNQFNGKRACINGATQIRAGVIRPEIIIPLDVPPSDRPSSDFKSEEAAELGPGAAVRVIREPYFGLSGRIVSLPVELQVMESESKVRVLKVALEDGREITVPRANVEAIEE